MVLDYDEFESVILALAHHMYNVQKRTEPSFEEYLGEVCCLCFNLPVDDQLYVDFDQFNVRWYSLGNL